MGSRTAIKSSRRSTFVLLLLGLALSPAAASAATRPVGQRAVPLPGSTDIGAAPATAALHLDVVLRPRDPAALTAFVAAVSDPTSPDYRRFLAPGEFAGRFGPTPTTVSAVERSLRAQGLRVDGVTPDRLVIDASTSAATAERAFAVPLRRVRAPSGAIGLLNTAAPQLPAAVAPDVTTIVGLDTQAVAHDLHAAAAPATEPAANATPSFAPGAPTPCTAASQAASTQTGFTADQLASAYDLNPLYAAGDRGAGQTIAVFELATFSTADVAAYQSCYGSNATVNTVTLDGGPTSAAGQVEVELDIEGILGLAPAATVTDYQAPNTGKGTLDAYQQIATDDKAKAVSTSWGNCDPTVTASAVQAEATIFAEMASQGQSMFAATGDDGSEDCSGNPHGSTGLSTDDPASQPNVTAVGGTTLTGLGAPPGTQPAETVWNDAAVKGGAGGGGISSNWAMPTYQSAPGTTGVANGYSSGTPCHATTGNCRELPDVAASADPYHGYVVYYTGTETGRSGWQIVGGTSASAPLWAAFAGLTNASAGCARAPVGLLNPALYQMAADTGYAGDRDFNDITQGNNDYLGTHAGAYPATTGYDMASGLGSPIGAVLARDLCTPRAAPAITSPAVASFGIGKAGSFTVTTSGSPVSTLAASGALPTGISFTDNHDGTATIAGSSSAEGAYPLTITAGNRIAQASQSFTLAVGPLPPTAAFSFTPQTPPVNAAVHFDATASTDPNPGGGIATYDWTFGDGATATGPTATHAYAARGTYTATLEVTSAEDKPATTTHQISVIGAPTPAFTSAQASSSPTVAFTDQSTPATGGPGLTSWAWSFGDGTTAATESPTHAYAAAGTYTVGLTVTAADGQTATTSHQITVAPEPAAAFAGAQTPVTLDVSFTDASTPAPGDTITRWTWSFGDATGAATQSPTHTYAAAGGYIATLTVTDSDGQTSTTSRSIAVQAPPTPPSPTADFTSAQSPISLAVAFTDRSSPATGDTLTSWAWSFGDGATATTQSPTHTYAAAGSYAVTLRVTDSDGKTSAASGVVVVTGLPATTPAPKATPAAAKLVLTRAKVATTGVISLTATPSVAGRLAIVATVPRSTASLSVLAPGAVFARRTLTVRAGASALKVNPAAGTARIKRLRRRHTVTITLRVTLTPASGAPAQATATVRLAPRH